MPKKTHAEAVLEILSDGQFHSTTELLGPKTGSEGLRRLRELRAKGYVIEKKRKPGSAQWLYRLWKSRSLFTTEEYDRLFLMGRKG